jgi:hypothetical protein
MVSSGDAQMEWLWFAGIGFVGLWIVSAAAGRKKTPEPNPLREMAQQIHTRRRVIDDELSKITRWILELDIKPLQGPMPAETLDRTQVGAAVNAAIEKALQTGQSTSTHMVHVARADDSVTLIAKLRPTKPEAVERVFERLAENTWHARTRRIESFDEAFDPYAT